MFSHIIFVDIFDVIMSYPDKPCILDFGSLNNKTNLYAFSWKEILPLLNKVIITRKNVKWCCLFF